MFDHDVVPLVNKAHAAACLLRFIMPDSLWKDQSVLSKAAAVVKAPPSAEGSPVDAPLSSDTVPDQMAQSIESTNEGLSKVQGGNGKEPIVPDTLLLDEATRSEVLRRARIVAGVSQRGEDLLPLALSKQFHFAVLFRWVQSSP
jgi:hypothetical protein